VRFRRSTGPGFVITTPPTLIGYYTADLSKRVKETRGSASLYGLEALKWLGLRFAHNRQALSRLVGDLLENFTTFAQFTGQNHACSPSGPGAGPAGLV
jgi:hypothetical protein